MGTPIYRLTFDEGGSEENADLEALKIVRDTKPGVITLHDLSFRVENDPAVKIYDSYQEAEQVHAALQGMYSITPINTLVSPQPPGLND